MRAITADGWEVGQLYLGNGDLLTALGTGTRLTRISGVDVHLDAAVGARELDSHDSTLFWREITETGRDGIAPGAES
jgi:hypothetical protein